MWPKNMIITNLTLVFLLVLFCGSLYALSVNQDPKVKKEGNSESSQQLQVQDLGVIQEPDLEYRAYNLRDPFEDLIARKKQEDMEKKPETEIDTYEQPPPLDVQGLVWGGAVHQAIINGKVVKVGDSIEGAEVIEIDKEGVSMLYKKRIFKLSSPASNYIGTGKQEVIK
jgi:hypothetical protein